MKRDYKDQDSVSEVKAFVGLEIENTQAKGLQTLFLDPSKKKQGAGGAVFRKGLEWLGDERPISLEVVAYNDDAIAFYEHFGFESTGDGKKVELPDGKIMPYLVMRKPSRNI